MHQFVNTLACPVDQTITAVKTVQPRFTRRTCIDGEMLQARLTPRQNIFKRFSGRSAATAAEIDSIEQDGGNTQQK